MPFYPGNAIYSCPTRACLIHPSAQDRGLWYLSFHENQEGCEPSAGSPDLSSQSTGSWEGSIQVLNFWLFLWNKAGKVYPEIVTLINNNNNIGAAPQSVWGTDGSTSSNLFIFQAKDFHTCTTLCCHFPCKGSACPWDWYCICSSAKTKINWFLACCSFAYSSA